MGLVGGFVLAGSAFAIHALHSAAVGGPVAVSLPGWIALALLAVVAGLSLLVMQHQRLCHHLQGPEQRLRGALQRIREGDLAFRVTLRKGDLLAPLADECNELLDWLNRNPPAAANRIGSDLVPLKARSKPPAVMVEPVRPTVVVALAPAGES